MKTLGIDLSSVTCGYAISENDEILNAGFFDISEYHTYKEKANCIIQGLSNLSFDVIQVEESLSGFCFGKTNQLTLIKLITNKSVICYILEEHFKIKINFYNVNTVRKKVLGACRVKGIKPKVFVKDRLEKILDISKWDKFKKSGKWDERNSDTYDAIIMSLYCA